MSWPGIKFFLIGVILIILQVTVFNHICIFGYAMAYIYIYIIITLPLSMSLNWVYTIGFVCGLIIDIFSDTYGINTISGTILSFLRRPVFNLYTSKNEEYSMVYISSKAIGYSIYAKFVYTLSLIYCAIVFTLESFTLFNFWHLILTIIWSSLFTFILILALNTLIATHEKRL